MVCSICSRMVGDVAMKEYPKVLIISHNVIGESTNLGKTLYSYFADWPSNQLCQLYLHEEKPTTSMCSSYYRVTDFDLLKTLVFLRKPGQEVSSPKETDHSLISDNSSDAQNFFYGIAKNPNNLIYFMRNALWRVKTWNNKKLKEWLNKEKPDVIFYAAGDYAFSFDMAVSISKEMKIPIVVSVVDDFYFYNYFGHSPIGLYNKRKFDKSMKSIMSLCRGAFYIHPKMKEKYDHEFFVPSEVLYPATKINETPEPQGKLKISYLGGLVLDRYKSLIEIGRVIKAIDQKNELFLDVYSSEKTKKIIDEMNETNGIRFNGEISPNEVIRIEKASNILIIAESCEEKSLNRIKYSLSSKTAEYLGLNRCIFAYGNADAGVISYLNMHNAACISTNKRQLLTKLSEIINDSKKRDKYAANGLRLAKMNHSHERNGKVIKKMIFCSIK